MAPPVGLFHSGAESFSVVDNLFWMAFFFFWVCWLHVCGSPVGSTSEMLHPLADSCKQSQPRGASCSQAQMALTGAGVGRQEVGSGSPPGPAVGTRPSFEVRKRGSQSCFDSHPPGALDLVNTPHSCFPFPGLRFGSL